MALIFNSITQYQIQPERTKVRVKRDDLDTLSEVWTGPSDYEDLFVPRIGNVHPQYSLMTVINTSVKRMPMSVSQVTINYQGKLDGSGSSAYTSVPTISQNWAEGEVSYQVNSGITLASAPGSGFGPITQGGVATYSHRYTGRGCQIAYITNQRPTGNPTNIGLSKDYLGFTNEWDIFSGFQPGAAISGGGSPIKQITCTNVAVEDRGDGWYRVIETYQSRMFPQATFAAPSAGAISVNTTDRRTFLQQEDDAFAAQAAAMQAAIKNNNGVLPMSPAGSIDNLTYRATGIDPAWSTVSAAPAAASSAASSSPDSVTGIGSGSMPLANGNTGGDGGGGGPVANLLDY